MKLSNLHASSRICLTEDLSQQEGLAYLQMMAAKQGIDPDPFAREIRMLMGGEIGQTEHGKAAFQKWISEAKPSETKTGKAFGRKVKITVLESVVRDLIEENVFSDMGDFVMKKLRSLLKVDDRQEHELVSKAIDEEPKLGAILRYAQRTQQPIYDDEKFWKLVDDVTGQGERIKAIVLGTYRRRVQENKLYKDTLTITEARMSEVMSDLGLSDDQINELMDRYGLQDKGYDLSSFKRSLSKAGGRVKEAISSLGDKAKNLVSETPEMDEEENMDFAEFVVLVAKTVAGERTKEEPERPREYVPPEPEEPIEYNPEIVNSPIGSSFGV